MRRWARKARDNRTVRERVASVTLVKRGARVVRWRGEAVRARSKKQESLDNIGAPLLVARRARCLRLVLTFCWVFSGATLFAAPLNSLPNNPFSYVRYPFLFHSI